MARWRGICRCLCGWLRERGTASPARRTLVGDSTGDEARIIANPDSGISSMAGLATHTFCRLGYTDVYSWLIPTLMMRASGIDSSSVLGKTQDYDSPAALIDAVESGDCDAAGIAGSQFDAIASASARSTLTHSSISRRRSRMQVLVYPPEVPPDQQQQLIDALVVHRQRIARSTAQSALTAGSTDRRRRMTISAACAAFSATQGSIWRKQGIDARGCHRHAGTRAI